MKSAQELYSIRKRALQKMQKSPIKYAKECCLPALQQSHPYELRRWLTLATRPLCEHLQHAHSANTCNTPNRRHEGDL